MSATAGSVAVGLNQAADADEIVCASEDATDMPDSPQRPHSRRAIYNP
jgi:hypothetical protein